jgi:hypothetical protein
VAAPTKKPEPGLHEKLLDTLRAHRRNRPSNRRALERRIATMAGSKPAPTTVEAIIADLEREGIVATDDKKITHAIPNVAKWPSRLRLQECRRARRSLDEPFKGCRRPRGFVTAGACPTRVSAADRP